LAERPPSGAVATACGVLVAVGLLVVTAVAASRTSTDLPGPRSSVEPVPVTTMAPVKPDAEAVTPEPARSRTDDASGDQASERDSRSGNDDDRRSDKTRADDAAVAERWLARTARETGIGRVALTAYASASLRLAREQPSCRIGWTTLAGIGAIESGHGTNGGASLRPDGTTSRRILGPPLDGTGGTAAIPSTADSVVWHGDRRWDHAVGPMQFIPSTWRRWGTDASGDGRADPNNVLDAAAAAARYLCASGGDLTTAEGWTRAVFSYNHSEDYVHSVLARANRYARP
jgi:membrane-bound lytic murein transglycosylase B